MKLLFVAPSDPYARDGGANLRLRAFAEAASSKCEAHILCLGSRRLTAMAGPAASIEAVAFRPPAKLKRWWRGLALQLPDLALRSRSVGLAFALHRRLISEQFAAVHLSGLQMAYLAETFWSTLGTRPGVAAQGRNRPALIVDALNAEYVVHSRLAGAGGGLAHLPAAAFSSVQSRLLRAYEARVLGEADAVTCPSDADRDSLIALDSRARIRVAPSGVRTSFYQGLPPPPDRPVAVFIGNLEYRPNRQALQWLTHSVAPIVWRSLPAAEFVVVGGGARPRLPAASLGTIRFTGYVDDVRPILAAAKAVVAPVLAGGGVKFKVLEGMAAGRPVVSTSIGAEGIAAAPGREILIGDGPQAFADALVSVLADTPRARAIGEAARRRAVAAYDAVDAGNKYMEVIEELTAGFEV